MGERVAGRWVLSSGRLKRWRVGLEVEETRRLAEALGLERLVAQVLLRRGLQGAEEALRFLDPRLSGLHDPERLSGCVRAADRLARAVRAGEHIVVYGDYDVDGITATAILFHALRCAAPGASIRCYVPHRIDEGYGLNVEAIGKLIDEGAKVIVSVDCGITAQEPAEVAAARGVDLIVTDHHEPGLAGALPPALAHVHPGLPGDGGEPYPFRGLCGAGVAYKLAWQFARAWCGTPRVSEEFRATLLDLLPLAALGTIADVVPLLDENRVIATCGLQRIKGTHLVGLNALIDATKLRDEQIDSSHVGFVLGPRLNACGRMGHARDAVELLTVARAEEAQRIAGALGAVNDERRRIERLIYAHACQLVEEGGHARAERRVIVLGEPGWHAGVIGVVCSRLVERYGRPTVLLHVDGPRASGSARSIDGFDIMEAFRICTEHLDRYGGHRMAAGLALRTEAIEGFREAINAHAAEVLKPEDTIPMVEVDLEVDLAELTIAVCQQLERLAPFGRSNPAPVVLLGGVQVAAPPRTMGQDQRHLSLTVERGGCSMRCVGWRLGELARELQAGARLDLVGEPRINRFRGRTSVELDIRDLRLAGTGER